MTIQVGQLVYYTAGEQQAAEMKRRRRDAYEKRDWHRENRTGAVVHVGNEIKAGQKYPMIVTAVWSPTLINGQVILDGNDHLWVTSIERGEGPHQWSELAP